MLKIDKIDNENIRIRQNAIDVNVAGIFFASVGESGMITIAPKEAGAYRSFSELLKNVEINGVVASSPEDTVKSLNSFIGNFKKAGSSAGNNGSGGVWGEITGDINKQTDLSSIINDINNSISNIQLGSNDSLLSALDSIEHANADVSIEIRNYVGNFENVHPKVLYFPTKLWGYQYWMAYTPYPGGQDMYENPHIAVSNDGFIWTVPSGLVNPITPKPAGGYNSDTHLVYRSDIATMELWYRPIDAAGLSALARKKSTDGINWSAEEILISGMPHADLLSPSLLFENGIYKMWFVNGNTQQMYYQESTNNTPTNWTARKQLAINYQAIGEHPWHLDVVNNGKDCYWIVFTGFGSAGNQNTSDLFAVKQKYDGTFENPFPIIRKSKNPQAFDNINIYRSSIVIINNVFFIYYSCNGVRGWAISLSYGKDLRGLNGIRNITRSKVLALGSTYDATTLTDFDVRGIEVLTVENANVSIQSFKNADIGQRIHIMLKGDSTKTFVNFIYNSAYIVVPGLTNKTLGITNVGCILMFESPTKCRIIATT